VSAYAEPPHPPKARPVLAIAIACFVLGCGCGFLVGVLSVKGARELASNLFRSERAAQVNQAIAVDRPAFQFEYAGNWHIDTESKDYDPDHMFSIDSPGQSFLMVVVADGELSPHVAVEKQVEAHTKKVMKEATKTELTEWGAHAGEGVLLKGKHLGISPGTIRIFAFREQGTTYSVIESTYDDDRANVQPGFDLIARTFRVKEP